VKSTTHVRLVAFGLLVCCLAGAVLAWKMRDGIEVKIEVDRQATSLRAATPEPRAPVPQQNTTAPATQSTPVPNLAKEPFEIPPLTPPLPPPDKLDPLPIMPPAFADKAGYGVWSSSGESIELGAAPDPIWPPSANLPPDTPMPGADSQVPQANLLQPVPAPPGESAFRGVPERKPAWSRELASVPAPPADGDKPEPGAVSPPQGVSATVEPPLATLKPIPTAQSQAVIVPASFTAIRPAAASVVRAAVRDKTLPLTGTHACKLDDGRRLILPKEVREQLGEAPALFFTPGPDQCLWLCTAAGLEKRMEQVDRSSADDAQARARRRLYFSQTEKCAVKWDQSGECSIPERLVQFAELRQEVVLVGVGDHFELWDAQRWQQYVQQNTEK